MGIEEVVKKLDKVKRFKDEYVIGDNFPPVNVLPTGIEELDSVVMGSGGLPKGKVTTLWGPYECGKSTLVAHIIAHMQKNNLGSHGNTVALFETEGKFVPSWWEDWGVDMSKVIMPKFTCGEDAFDQMMLMFGEIDIIVVDSIATLVSKEKATRGDSKMRIGSEARMLSDKIKDVKNGTYSIHKNTGAVSGILTPKLGDTDTVLLMINQIRENIGVMFGKKQKLPGGNINNHLNSILLRMDIIGYGKERDNSGGVTRQKVRIKCERNHYAPPQRSCDVWMNVQDKQFEMVSASFILNLAIDKGLLEQRGAWIYGESLPDGKIHGMEKLMQFLDTDEGKKLKEVILDTVDMPLPKDIETESILDDPDNVEIDEKII